MKTFKTILAYLDWSNFALDHTYNYPTNLCSLFWRTVLSLLILPFTWMGQVINLFALEDFRREYSAPLSFYFSSLINGLLVILGGMFNVEILVKKFGLDTLSIDDFILWSYIKIIFFGLISLIILVCVFFILFAIVWAGRESYFAIARFLNRKKDFEGTIVTEKEPSRLQLIYKSIKDKTCLLINWDEIRN